MKLDVPKNSLIIFTNNADKLNEFRAMLSGQNRMVLGYREVFKEYIDVVEDGQTFEENVLKKVNAAPRVEGAFFLADDSGLEVDALDKRPGIYSARYGGDISSRERCALLLSEMEGVTDRSARFRCVIALRFPDGHNEVFDGRIEGAISDSIRGENGFGYDPVFIPLGHSVTFAEMTSDEKHVLSHRGKALNKVSFILKEH